MSITDCSLPVFIISPSASVATMKLQIRSSHSTFTSSIVSLQFVFHYFQTCAHNMCIDYKQVVLQQYLTVLQLILNGCFQDWTASMRAVSWSSYREKEEVEIICWAVTFFIRTNVFPTLRTSTPSVWRPTLSSKCKRRRWEIKGMRYSCFISCYTH